MKKIVFLDVDGTLVNDNGVIPFSAEEAVKKARAKGNEIFLCTGRSLAEIYPHILEIGFDGIIAAGGGYVEYKNSVIFHETIDNNYLIEAVEFFEKNDIDFYLESNEGLYASKHMKKNLREIIDNYPVKSQKERDEMELGFGHFFDALIENQYKNLRDVNKIVFLGSKTPFDEIKNLFESKFTLHYMTVPMFGENGGELSIKGISKSSSIKLLLEHLGAKQEDTFAYGDGMNDYDMLLFANMGIAMGNAKEALKKIADDITDTHDEDGIYNSFKKYALID